MPDAQFAAVVAAISALPCRGCGKPLGNSWAEKYVERADRLYRFHPNCGPS